MLSTKCLALFSVLFCALAASALADEVKPPIDAFLSVDGEPEVVFDWSKDRCEFEDIPDLAARAFRAADGTVNMLDTHHVWRRATGPTLDTVKHRCKVVFNSAGAWDGALYNHELWVGGLHTEDGNTIYVLQHQEYYGAKGQCYIPQAPVKCWINGLTMAVSTDGGKSYHEAGKPPANFVAAQPFKYMKGAGPYGIFEPSNLVEGPDGYLYATVMAKLPNNSDAWTCILRTKDLSDATSWRAWDGKGFNLEFVNPYTTEVANPADHECAAISKNEIADMHQSLTFNTYLGQYVLVSTSADSPAGREVWGIYYSFSTDLIHWTPRQLLLEHELPWTWKPGDDDPILYPSLLDPASPSRNFETTGQRAYLYVTRSNHRSKIDMWMDRDLIRYPIEFTKAEVDAPQYEFKISGIVPGNATTALLGFRFNTECQCRGDVHLNLYSVRYVEGDGDNLVPNPQFMHGTKGWAISGNGYAALNPTDLAPEGHALRVVAQEGQAAIMDGTAFPVTPGRPFTGTFTAKVWPSTTSAGYFTVIFLASGRETSRLTVAPTPNIAPPG